VAHGAGGGVGLAVVPVIVDMNTPPERTFVVPAEFRTFTVAAETRTWEA